MTLKCFQSMDGYHENNTGQLRVQLIRFMLSYPLDRPYPSQDSRLKHLDQPYLCPNLLSNINELHPVPFKVALDLGKGLKRGSIELASIECS